MPMTAQRTIQKVLVMKLNQTTWEAQEELGEEVPGPDPSEKLLDRLLYRGATSSICLPYGRSRVSCFDQDRSTRFRGVIPLHTIPGTSYCPVAVCAWQGGMDR